MDFFGLSKINMIISLNIINKSILAIIARAMATLPRPLGEEPENLPPVWPGVEFAVDPDGGSGLALLGEFHAVSIYQSDLEVNNFA